MTVRRNVDHSTLAGQMTRGRNVIIGLAVLTILEFVVSAADVAGSFWMLTVIAIAKAGLIVHYFMHFHQIWRDHTWQ